MRIRAVLTCLRIAVCCGALWLGLRAATPAPPAQSGQVSGNEKVFYVSTEGNDAWSGLLAAPNTPRSDGPFASLPRARQAVRALKAQGVLTQPVTVYLRGGRYDIREPIVFTSEDSGTPQCPVVYAGYQAEVPVLSGGRPITGWKRAPEAGSPEVWMAPVPGVKEGSWYFHQLFIDGERRQRARTPNVGVFNADGTVTADRPASFKFHANEIDPAWAAQPDAEVVMLLKWAGLRMPIRAVQPDTRTVVLAGRRQHWGDDKNPRYWVENVPDALDQPGEWYLDRRTGLLYYWPKRGEDLTRVEAIAPFLTQLVLLRGYDQESRDWVENIVFRGLVLAYTDWSVPAGGYADMQAAIDVAAAVDAIGAVSCRIERCVFTHLGGYALAFGTACRNNQIVRNEMSDLGGGGVKIGPVKAPNESDFEISSGNSVTANHIYQIGHVFPGADAIWVGQSNGNLILHNHIHHTFVTAISVGWTWGYMPSTAHENRIEWNHIHDVGQGVLSDMACVYTLGAQPGTVIRNNLCHDVRRYELGYGGWGIYFDEGSSRILAENNIVYRTDDGGLHHHYGEDNRVSNNIFALGKTAQVSRSRQENHISFTFERNIVYWEEGKLLGGRWDNNQFRFDRNLYFLAARTPFQFGPWPVDDWKKRGQDSGSLVADPLFVAPEKGDFSLKEGSPAYRIGFETIDLKGVGPAGAR